MVAFLVEVCRLSKDVPGTEFNAVPAAFAAVGEDMDLADGDRVLLRIERHSPERKCHTRLLAFSTAWVMVSATRAPALLRAAIFDSAVPVPPAMMAPA